MTNSIATTSTPLQFSHVAELDGDIDTINALMNTGDGMVRWVPNCRSVHFEHPHGALAAGSVRYVRLKIGLLAAERITFLDSPTKLNYTIDSMGGMRLDGLLKDYEGVTVLEPLENRRYRLTWSVHFYCTGIMKLFEPLARAGLSAFIGLMVSNICREANGKRLK